MFYCFIPKEKEIQSAFGNVMCFPTYRKEKKEGKQIRLMSGKERRRQRILHQLRGGASSDEIQKIGVISAFHH